MHLDGEEERMLCAIVQSAIVAAAAGRPFAGEFHHFVIRATCLQVNVKGVAAVAVTIRHRGFALARAHCVVSLCDLRHGAMPDPADDITPDRHR